MRESTSQSTSQIQERKGKAETHFDLELVFTKSSNDDFSLDLSLDHYKLLLVASRLESTSAVTLVDRSVGRRSRSGVGSFEREFRGERKSRR